MNINKILEYYHEKHKLTHILTTHGENILQNLRYDYDGFSNLASRKDEERDMRETFTYDHLNRLTGIWLNGVKTGWMGYDGYGRMTRKVIDNSLVFTNAIYDETPKPHAIDRADTDPQVFSEQNVTYTNFDKVKHIEQNGNTVDYTYGYDRQRIFMEEHVGNTTRTKRYIGNCELLTVTTNEGTTSEWHTFLTAPTGVYAVVVSDLDKHTLHYVLKDNLGSWTTITDRFGNVEQQLSYDAWGTLRDPDTWQNYSVAEPVETPMFDRGFTGHEHLYAFGLINMNGRIYDPQMSSFLSVDAYVQSPDNAQSFNRYAYCQNNPLRYVDPSGWLMLGAGHGTSFNNNPGWGESYSQHAYEPRELGMLQLPGCSVMTWWMEGKKMLGGGGGGGSSSYGGFYDEKGRYLGSDRQNTGKVYVIRSEIKEVMDKKDEIISFFLNKDSSLSWNDVYDCFVEIVPSRFMRNMMYTIVSKDDGKGGTKESNNREYGGFINEVGMVIAVDAGEPKNPNVHGDIISIDFPYGTKYATFHSHPSGTGESYFDDLGEHTPIFQQEPTKTDFSIAGNHICYVFGRRSDLVYVYNKNGIQTIIQTSCFINKFNP